MDKAGGVCSRDAAGDAALARPGAEPYVPALSLKLGIYLLLSPKNFTI